MAHVAGQIATFARNGEAEGIEDEGKIEMMKARSPNSRASRLPYMPVIMETMPQQSSDFVGTRQFNLEEWAFLLRSTCGGDHEVIDPDSFAGWMRQLSVYGVAAAAIKIQCGLTAVDHGDNTYRFERTRRDVRDWYLAQFQVAGRSRVTQNDHTVQLAVGDIGLVDGPRPLTRISESGSQWLSIYLPRQPVISHLGFEPQSSLYGHGGTLAARVLRQLVLEGIGDEESMAAPAGPTCGSPSTIYLAPYLRRLMRDSYLVMRTSCSLVSGVS